MPRPHGGTLIDRILRGKQRKRTLDEVSELPKIRVSNALIKDIENIAYGVFSPLEGFIGREDYMEILHHQRLKNGLPWTIPILLDVSEKEQVAEGDDIVIANETGQNIAVMRIEEKYTYAKKELALHVFKTLDIEHPGVAKTLNMKERLLGGVISLITESTGPFEYYRLKPVETRVLFKEKGWRTIAGFQTRNVPHLGHESVQKTALTFVDGIFIQPLIGKKKRGDFKDDVILATYDTLIKNYYLKNSAVLAILESEMRYAGPYEAIFHAIIRKNFGCTHFIVGRDHAGFREYYDSYAAQELFQEFPDLDITPIFFKSFFYCKTCGGVVNEKTCPHPPRNRVNFSGTKIRELLKRGEPLSQELMRPEVVDIVSHYENPFIE